jgi:carbamoyl-phosphate synthase large subunit
MMPDLKDRKVMIIGAGPAIIGQGSECDEGAFEACRALAAAGCRIVAVNSNPDAVMTSGDRAETTHIQPLTSDTLARLIAQEKPHALLPAFGGRSGLHLAAQLARQGILHQHQVTLWGLSASSLEKVLDRDALKSSLSEIGLNTPPIFTLHSIDTAIEKAQQLGFPVVLRCDHPDLMPDGVLVYNQDELREKAAPLAGEPDSAISVEASLLAWQQVELEILRDHTGHTKLAGGVEYIDTAGVHPGDALGISPPQSLGKALINRLTTHATAIADHFSIVGSATVRFAFQVEDGPVLVLAVHPRHTRTSALVTRTADQSIAGLAALLAAGCAWDELPQQMTQPHPNAEPMPAIAVKWPHWSFDHLEHTSDRLGPQMQAIGQSVGYGSNFKEALQKAARAATGNDAGLAGAGILTEPPLDDLMARLSTPASQRIFVVYEVLRRGASGLEVAERTHITPWVIEQIIALIATETELRAHQGSLPPEALLRRAKSDGFSNAYLAQRLELSPEALIRHLDQLNIQPVWRALSSSNKARCFSTYGGSDTAAGPAGSKSILILGSGAHGIGQGPECDFGLYQAAQALQALGYGPIVFNCNLTSVTTGPAMALPCYCDPISAEELLAVIDKEKPLGIITQFAGTLAPQVLARLASSRSQILGTPLDTLALVRNRAAFHEQMRTIGIPQPMAGLALSVREAQDLASKLQFPLLVQPVDPKMGKEADLIMDQAMLDAYLDQTLVAAGSALWIEKFLEYAIEAQAETLCDGTDAHVAVVMEHIELAGVHAGDSACVVPPYSIAPRHLETITEYCRKIATALKIQGLVNLRFAIYRDTVYLLQATCNASRNLSLVTHARQLPLAGLAAQLMLGRPLKELPLATPKTDPIGVRAAVFPFNVFSAEDPLLGPKMRATGQVLALADSFGLAYFNAQLAATTPLPTKGCVLITVTDEDKPSILEPARIFQELGFNILATRGTQAFLAENGIESQTARKLGFGRPNLLDDIKNGSVQMVINTPTGGQGQIDDSLIRKTAIRYHIANITTPASALAAAKGIAAQRS